MDYLGKLVKVEADPKDRVHSWEKAQFANQLVRLGQFEEAEIALRQVIVSTPWAEARIM